MWICTWICWHGYACEYASMDMQAWICWHGYASMECTWKLPHLVQKMRHILASSFEESPPHDLLAPPLPTPQPSRLSYPAACLKNNSTDLKHRPKVKYP